LGEATVKALAIVGLGRWGKVLVDAVQGRSRRVRFIAAVVRDRERSAADAAARGLRLEQTLETVLSDPGVDGVVLATPHSQHAEQIIACAGARKPVFVEKPVTLTRASADQALAAAAGAGTLVAAGFNRRFLTAVADLKAMIEAGTLGTLLHVETHFSGNVAGRYKAGMWRVAPGESPAGGLAGSGIHQIDAIIHLAGPIAEVYAVSTRRVHAFEMDDTTMVTFRLASGAVASLLTITATASTYRITVFGTRGKAELNGAAELRGSETLDVTFTTGDSQRRSYAPFDIERAELEAFADAIDGLAPYPVTTAELLNGVSAFEAVSLSVARGGPVAIAP
jgi:predicted dehydrogenase